MCVSETDLILNLDKQLKEDDVENAMKLIKSNNYSDLRANSVECIKVILRYLTEDNYENKYPLYTGCEDILQIISTKCNLAECIFEFLEAIEVTKNDTVFTSILKPLQLCILQLKNNESNILEWCLNCIQIYVMEKPSYAVKIKQYFIKQNEKLMEECDEVKRILTLYMTLFLFYEPLLNTIMEFQYTEEELDKLQPSTKLFVNNNLIRKNVLTCFIIQLFDRPLAYLHLVDVDVVDGVNDTTTITTNDTSNKLTTNKYSVRCAKRLIEHITQLIPDPLKLLFYVERQILWPIIIQSTSNGVYENSPRNTFLMIAKIPFTAIGVYFYLLLSENMMPETAPKIYTKFYIFDKCLSIITELLKTNDELIIYKALRLGIKNITNLSPHEKITVHVFDSRVHSEFCKHLIDTINAENKLNEKKSLLLFARYVFQLENEAKYILIKHLFQIVENDGFYGVLITIYKDMLNELIETNEIHTTPWFSGKHFKIIFTNHICKLKNGEQTDILNIPFTIIAVLKLITYLSVRDSDNQSSYWDCLDTIRKQFLNPLATAININKSYYNSEIKSVKSGSHSNVKNGKIMSIEDIYEMYRVSLETLDTMHTLLHQVQTVIKHNYPINVSVLHI